MGYEQVYKFDVLNKFLGMEAKEFETFRKNYASRKGHLLGDKHQLSLKDIERMKKENKLTTLFDQEVLGQVEDRFMEEENNPTGEALTREQHGQSALHGADPPRVADAQVPEENFEVGADPVEVAEVQGLFAEEDAHFEAHREPDQDDMRPAPEAQ